MISFAEATVRGLPIFEAEDDSAAVSHLRQSSARHTVSLARENGRRAAARMERRAEIQAEALAKAESGQSTANYAAIYEGFTAKGIDADEILPRVNVFTFNAWKAKGRKVRKGEHGVKVCTWIPTEKTEAAPDGGERTVQGKRPWMTTVFHVSQTEPIAPFFGR